MSPSDRYCASCGTLQRATPGPRTPAGWYPDPFGRAARRYFDGEIWTDQVYAADGYRRDLVAIDHRGDRRGPDGPFRASGGSLSWSIGGIVVAFALSYLCILPWLLTGHPGGYLAGLCCSEAGLWAGLFGTCVATSRRFGSGRLAVDFHLRLRPVDAAIGIGAALVARLVAGVVLLPFAGVEQHAGNPDASLESITHLGALGWFVLVALTCVGAPFFEELFFRGLLQGELVERYRPSVAIVATSIVFGAVHVANDPGIAGLLLALGVGTSGLVLGVVRRLTGRLGSSIATHAVFNAVAVIALALSSTR